MNHFHRALSRISSAFSGRGAPRNSVAAAYGIRGNKELEQFLNDPLERGFGFEGAWYDRTNSNWVAWRSSLDAILRTSIWILIGRVRDLQRTNSIVQRAINLWKNNVVGPHGVRMRMSYKTAKGDLDQPTNKAIMTQWYRFCHAENLTPAGNMDMVEFQKHIFGTVPIDGTCLVREFRGPQYPQGIAFRIIEVDLLDINKFKGDVSSETETKFGIESNRKTGKITGYWLYLTNPNDLSLGSTYTAGVSYFVGADEIILVMKPERPAQTIGTPWFVRAMTNLHILQSYTKAALIKAQMAASYFVFITNQLAVQESDDGAEGDPNGFQQMPVENGVSLELKKGQDVKNVAPAQAGSDFEVIFKWTLRFIGGDLDLSYHSFSEDTSEGNYASLRMAAMEERAGYIANQVWLASRMLRPMFVRWLKVQLKTQRIKLPDSLFDDLIYAVEWIGRRWDWVDPKNEATAAVALVNAAMETRTQYWKDRGFDTEDKVAELDYEQTLLEDGEIVIQTTSGQQMHFGQTDQTAAVAPKKTTGKPAGADDDESDDKDE